MTDLPTDARLDDSERAFAARAMRRKNLFRTLSNVSVAVAVGLTLFYGIRKFRDPTYDVGARFVVILLILLNARQNLRQHKYALLLEKLLRS